MVFYAYLYLNVNPPKTPVNQSLAMRPRTCKNFVYFDLRFVGYFDVAVLHHQLLLVYFRVYLEIVRQPYLVVLILIIICFYTYVEAWFQFDIMLPRNYPRDLFPSLLQVHSNLDF